jgi:hypothetical protein
MRKIPLAEIIPNNRSPKQARSFLRRKGVHPRGRKWEFTPRKAAKIEELLDQ